MSFAILFRATFGKQLLLRKLSELRYLQKERAIPISTAQMVGLTLKSGQESPCSIVSRDYRITTQILIPFSGACIPSLLYHNDTLKLGLVFWICKYDVAYLGWTCKYDVGNRKFWCIRCIYTYAHTYICTYMHTYISVCTHT